MTAAAQPRQKKAKIKIKLNNFSNINITFKETHALCRECLQNYTEAALESKPFARGWLGLKCVAENCANPIPWQEIKFVLPDELEAIETLEKLCAELCASAANEYGVEEIGYFDENELHAFCRECLKGYTKAALETKPFARGWLGLKCMAVKCQNPIPWQEIKKADSSDELDETIKTLENYCAELSVSAAGLCLERCPKCNCAVEMDGPLPVSDTNDSNEELKFHCPECNYEMCRKCNEKWTEEHNNLTCEQFAKQQNHEGYLIDKQLSENVVNGFTKCPKCKSPVEKIDGCNHMTCTCKFQFWYCCGADYKIGHAPSCTELD
ncbi:hypothetical protein niasHS_003031 [Heterodera schachtii]|uniref:RING-type domain-containing protein n=1 Tax=Heterodera schachtii TaxID=97005 RepID=A0ABD2K9N5_HETSC